MSINKNDFKILSALSMLEINEKDAAKFIEDFNKTLEEADKILSVNTEKVEPLIHIFKTRNIFREDMPAKSGNLEEMLKSAPSAEETAFLVPKTFVE